MKLHIKNGRFIDPRSGTDAKQDVYIAAGRVVALGSAPADFKELAFNWSSRSRTTGETA